MTKTQCVAKALILDKNSDFLLLTRSDTHPHYAGYYDLPGGGVEKAESYRKALVREVHEETGLSLDEQQIRVLYTVTQVIHGVSYPTVLYYARLDKEKPDIDLSYEHKSFDWAHIDRLSEVEPQIAPTYREALSYIRDNDVISDIDTV